MPINVDPLSLTSLMIRPYFGGLQLGTATGFIVTKGDSNYLFTNKHVVTGRHWETGKCLSPNLSIPDELEIIHHSPQLGRWFPCREKLLTQDGQPRWIEHVEDVDVVMLKLENTTQVQLRPLDLNLAEADIMIEPGMAVSIIGFPLGLTNLGSLPIWKTGHVASDPEVPFRNKPAFLIDATTKQGMSGSPVILRHWGSYRNKTGGGGALIGGALTRLLGIYSGRLPKGSHIGIVWRPSILSDLLAQTI